MQEFNPQIGECWRWIWSTGEYTTIRVERVKKYHHGIEMHGTVINSTYSAYRAGANNAVWKFGGNYTSWKRIRERITIYDTLKEMLNNE